MAVTANQATPRREGCRGAYPVEESTHLYEGTLVFLNAAGYAVGDTGSGANRFAGVCVEEVDNSAGADGDAKVEVYRRGQFLLSGSGFAQTSVGQPAYATDNFTVTVAGGASGAVRIGTIVEYISATKVVVEIDGDDPRSEVATVAGAGSSQTDAAQLTGGVNIVTGADGTVGVKLPPASPGKQVLVYNTHASNGLKIYPATGGDINDGTTNAAITIEGKTLATFVGLDTTTWAATFTANS